MNDLSKSLKLLSTNEIAKPSVGSPAGGYRTRLKEAFMFSQYAIAYGLVGFRSSTVRVRVIEERSGYVWVVTADLQDAGTPLTLNRSQIEYELEWQDETNAPIRHSEGLVTFS